MARIGLSACGQELQGSSIDAFITKLSRGLLKESTPS